VCVWCACVCGGGGDESSVWRWLFGGTGGVGRGGLSAEAKVVCASCGDQSEREEDVVN